MKRNRFREYMVRSLTGFGTLAFAILFFFLLYNIKGILGAVGALLTILMPLIYGLVISLLLSPMCEGIEKFLEESLPQWKQPEKRSAVIRGISIAGSILITLLVVILILVLVLPQLFESIMNLANSLPVVSQRLVNWVRTLLSDQPQLQQQILTYYNDFEASALNWLQNSFLPKFQDLLNSLSSGLIQFVVVLKNLILGLIISIYVLANRRLFKGQAKKFIYAVLPAKGANWVLYLCRDVRDVFSGFLVGKLLDSLIIGILCFIVMSILRFPYTILISTVVGVTNIIPYFGPFFGAIPSALLVLTVSPIQTLYFLIFILVLQQVDGNIIGPRILGSATGLSSFWVLISLLVFGGLFGPVGMVIGVPVFAVLYDLVSKLLRWLLEKKDLPQSSGSYADLHHVDVGTNTVVEKGAETAGKRGAKTAPDEAEAGAGDDGTELSGEDSEEDDDEQGIDGPMEQIGRLVGVLKKKQTKL